jgi:hypothetical protein
VLSAWAPFHRVRLVPGELVTTRSTAGNAVKHRQSFQRVLVADTWNQPLLTIEPSSPQFNRNHLAVGPVPVVAAPPPVVSDAHSLRKVP